MDALNRAIAAAHACYKADPTLSNKRETEALMNRATARAWCGNPDALLPDLLRVDLPPTRDQVLAVHRDKGMTGWLAEDHGQW